MAKVSIIINNYNLTEKYIKRAVQSVAKQTIENYECIIIDDCSSSEFNHDKFYSQFKNNNRYKYIKLDNNVGLGPARNIGIKHATGDLLIFLDGDDLLTSDAVEYVSSKFDEYNYDILHFNHVDIFNDECKIRKYNIHENLYDNSIDSFRLSYYSQIQRIKFAISKKFIEDNNLYFYDSRNIHEDVYYCLLIKTLAKKILISNKIIYLYDRSRSSSITNADVQNSSKYFIEYSIWAYEWLSKNKKINDLFFLNIIYYIGKFIGNNLGSKYRDCFFNKKNKKKYNKNLTLKWRMLYYVYLHKSLWWIYKFAFNNKILRSLLKN